MNHNTEYRVGDKVVFNRGSPPQWKFDCDVGDIGKVEEVLFEEGYGSTIEYIRFTKSQYTHYSRNFRLIMRPIR